MKRGYLFGLLLVGAAQAFGADWAYQPPAAAGSADAGAPPEPRAPIRYVCLAENPKASLFSSKYVANIAPEGKPAGEACKAQYYVDLFRRRIHLISWDAGTFKPNPDDSTGQGQAIKALQKTDVQEALDQIEQQAHRDYLAESEAAATLEAIATFTAKYAGYDPDDRIGGLQPLKKTLIYRNDYRAATTQEAIKAFEEKYAHDDPDNLIPALQPLKRSLEQQQYRLAFAGAKTDDDLGRAIDAYRGNDPELLVPVAEQKRAAIRQAALTAFRKALACDPQFVPAADGRACAVVIPDAKCHPPQMTEDERGSIVAALAAGPGAIAEAVTHAAAADATAGQGGASCAVLTDRIQAYKHNVEEETRIAEAERAQQLAQEERRRKLQSGKLKAQNFGDAVLLNADAGAMSALAGKPLPDADRKAYGGAVRLEAKEAGGLRGVVLDDNVLGKSAAAAAPAAAAEPHYVVIRTNPRTVQFGKKKKGPAIGDSVKVMGRYVGNEQTKDGAHTVPVLEAMYIE